MKFLVDNAISIVVSKELLKMGYDSLHVREIGLQKAKDIEIFELAYKEKRIIISADTDFGFLLSQWNKNKPSAIIFRKGVERDPFKQIELLKLNLTGQVLESLDKGSIIIIETNRIRIKPLPFMQKDKTFRK
ncbi:MAG: DUF5615 family PIN-like protein [Ignavibacteria bacterium]|nr:DUF5615 family PIN-like protein [Ignavibacteria bacterium]